MKYYRCIAVKYITIVLTSQQLGNFSGKPLASILTEEDTPYPALKGELRAAFRELFAERWPRNIKDALSCFVTL